jgi:transposase
MDYPQAVITKAHKMERLLQRVAQGEPLAQVCAELEVEVNEKQLAKLRAKYKAGGEKWEALLDGRYGHTQKVHAAMLAWLYERKEQDETLRAPALAIEMAEQFGVRVTDGHINHLLRKRELTAPPGRPYKHPPTEQAEEPSPTSTESLDNAGSFFPGSSQGRDGGLPGR